MERFPAKYDVKPHEAQLAKEVWESLGCKDPLTRAFISVAFYAIRVFDWKQRSYGVGNIARNGGKGVATRLGDKLARIENFYSTGRDGGEPVEDAFGDLGNYGLIGLMCRYGLWPGSPEQAPKEPA